MNRVKMTIELEVNENLDLSFDKARKILENEIFRFEGSERVFVVLKNSQLFELGIITKATFESYMLEAEGK
jgi:hypothetical protein